MQHFLRSSGVTQAHVARRSGIDAANLSRIASGRTVPLVTTAMKLAHVLETSVEALFGVDPPAASHDAASLYRRRGEAERVARLLEVDDAGQLFAKIRED